METSSRSNKCRIFISYARKDNEHDNDLIEKVVEGLKRSVAVRTQVQVEFFFDRDSLEWGDIWRDVIRGAVSESVLLICFVSPSYLGSMNCYGEWQDFVNLEKSLKFNNLILPIYYRTDREFELGLTDPTMAPPFAEDLAQRNFVDWRKEVEKVPSVERLRSLIEELATGLETRIHKVSELFVQKQSPLIGFNSAPADQEADHITTVSDELGAAINMKFNNLRASQKRIFKIIYGQPNDGEMLLDDLFDHIDGDERVQVASHDELYYRLKDLWHQSLIDLKSAGERKTVARRINEVEFVAVRDKLLERSIST